MDFYAARNHRHSDESEQLMESYFRCLYDFIASSMYKLDMTFPLLHDYYPHKQPTQTNFYSVVRLPRHPRRSSSSGYGSEYRHTSIDSLQDHEGHINSSVLELEEQEVNYHFT